MVQAREERPVPEDFVDERIRVRLERKMDGQPERARVAIALPFLPFDGSGVGGFHQSRTAAGDDVDAHPGELEAELLGLLVNRISEPDARAAEYRNAVMLHALGLDLIEVVDRVPELVDGLVEDVRRIDRRSLLHLLFAQLLELRRGGLTVGCLFSCSGHCLFRSER